jgi:hypothetical protein
LALAELVEDTEAAWLRFVDHVKTLPEDEQRALLTAFPALVPPEPEKPAPSTA